MSVHEESHTDTNAHTRTHISHLRKPQPLQVLCQDCNIVGGSF